MNILSVDVGMKNLGFCLFHVEDNKFSITKWDTIDLCNEVKVKCQGMTKKKGKCDKLSKYCKNGEYYCKTHAKNKEFKIPHVGWNSLNITKSTDSIFKEFDGNDFYFIHSQSFKCDKKYIVATTNYNIDFVSVVRNNHIIGVQFHPEKSSIYGEKLIRNFINNKYH